MALAAEAELGAHFTTVQKLIPIRQTRIEMGWLQLPGPVQTDNTTSVGVVNKTLVSNKLKSMDLCFHWLCCRAAKKQLRVYWDKGPNNWGNYSTKHHPPVYHGSKRPLFVGAATFLYKALQKSQVSRHMKTTMCGTSCLWCLEHYYVTARVFCYPIVDTRVHTYLHV